MIREAFVNSVGSGRLHKKQLLEILMLLPNLEPICQANKAYGAPNKRQPQC